MRIEEAKEEDFPKLVKLINETYWYHIHSFFYDVPESVERINLKELHNLLQSKIHRIFTLINDETIAGVIVTECPVEKVYMKFSLFAVDKSMAGKKVGHLLIDHVESFAKKQSKKSIKIEVLIFQEKLVRYYQQLGYAFTGKTFPFSHVEYVKPEFRTPIHEMEKIL